MNGPDVQLSIDGKEFFKKDEAEPSYIVFDFSKIYQSGLTNLP